MTAPSSAGLAGPGGTAGTAAAKSIWNVRRSRWIREALATGCFLLIALAAYAIQLGQGPVHLSPVEVLDVLTGGGDSRAIMVVWDLRLPVALATLVVGAALGACGAWTQTMARNPMASPDVLGVSGGAAVAVVWGTIVLRRPEFASDIPAFWWRAALAILGATAVVLFLALVAGVTSSQRVVLVGLALSLLAGSLVYGAVAKVDARRAAEAQTWLAGSVDFVRLDGLVVMVLAIAPFVALGVAAHRDLALLAHDDTTAIALGARPARTRGLLLIAATGTVAIVVSLVGPIGFVALVAPQIARLVTRAPLPSALSGAAAGAALLASCAVISGALPISAPVGVVTAICGGPVLVWLVMRGAASTGTSTGRNAG